MDVKSGAEQPDDAVGGECNDAEHQVAERLEVAANTEMAATEFIFDASIGAFCGGPLVVYSAHARTRKSAGSMTRKLSVTWSQ